MDDRPAPGVSRENRISDEGLLRLKRQLESGVRVSDTVLQQWIKRYGDDARVIIEKYRLELEMGPETRPED